MLSPRSLPLVGASLPRGQIRPRTRERTPLFGMLMTGESLPGDWWSQWPAVSLGITTKYNFRTWGGPTLNLGFGGALFNIVDPVNLEHILRSPLYEKQKLHGCFEEIFGDFLFTRDGDIWKAHRRAMVSVLSSETVSRTRELLGRRLQYFRKTVADHDGVSRTVEVKQWATDIMMYALINVAFGFDLDESEMQEFGAAFDGLHHCVHRRLEDFLWEFKKNFRLGARERQAQEHKATIDRITYAAMDRAMAASDQFSLVRLYTAKNPDASRKEVRDFLMTFVMAGRDTTAAALTWIIFELTRHPSILEDIREEVRVHGWSETAKLTRTKAVIMECLRLHSPAPDLFRFNSKDDTLPDGTRIPKGSCVMYSPYSINRNPNFWKDPETFDPKRWETPIGPFQSPTFNAGHRICPGKSLALVELTLIIAYVVSEFEFEGEHSGDFVFNLVMTMKGDFPVQFSTRRS